MAKTPSFVVSLLTQDNDYQVEQAASAEDAARALGVDVQIIYADNDSILQSQQILKFIQGNPELHPDGIVLEPVGGTGLPQVARAATSISRALPAKGGVIIVPRANPRAPRLGQFWARRLRPGKAGSSSGLSHHCLRIAGKLFSHPPPSRHFVRR